MDYKQIKFLQLFGELAKVQLTDTDMIKTKLLPIIKLDFDFGLDIWEYLTTAYSTELSQSLVLSEFFGNSILQLFYDISAQKTINAICDTDNLAKFSFEYNPCVDKGIALDIILNAITANKLDLATFVLNIVQKNTRISFDNYLKIIVEHTIAQAIKKMQASQKNILLPKKQAALLLSYINKLKGTNKALLEQRIKEVS